MNGGEMMMTKLMIEVETKGEVQIFDERYRHRSPSWVGESRCPFLPDVLELAASSERAIDWTWTRGRRWISASCT